MAVQTNNRNDHHSKVQDNVYKCQTGFGRDEKLDKTKILKTPDKTLELCLEI